jgi:hypothetical protein
MAEKETFVVGGMYFDYLLTLAKYGTEEGFKRFCGMAPHDKIDLIDLDPNVELNREIILKAYKARRQIK